MTIQTILVFTVLALMVLFSIFISAFLSRRAVDQVIDRLCSYHALDPKNARRAEEIGVSRRDFVQRMFRPRDYKPYALQFLKTIGAVLMTKEGKLYLVEEKLGDDQKCTRRG